ncbi:MAG TPA: hypothetical protein VN917_07595 [Xanthobacteraceae bacterium]|nr:hypothetical protein [Xanthobacteraceae bacterium]
MSADLLSWLWYILAAALLPLAIGYAQWAWRKAPHPASERVRDEATKQHYRGK